MTNEINNRKLTSQLRPPRDAFIAGRAEGFTLGRKQGPKELYNSFARLLKKKQIAPILRSWRGKKS